PAISWRGELSIEVAIALLLIVVAHSAFQPKSPRDGARRSRARMRALAAIWVALTIGHYADVTTPALYGRDINLYWDVRYMPDVAAMITTAVPPWITIAAVVALAIVVAALYAIFRWALGRVVAAMDDRRVRAGAA